MWRDGYNGKASAVIGWRSCPLGGTLIQHRHEPIRSDRLRVARFRALLPNKPRGVPRVDDRRLLKGIFWVCGRVHRGATCRSSMGPRTTCYNRIVRWRKAGVWDRLMDAITIAHDGDIQMIDSTSVRVHQQAATAHDGQIADTLLDHLVPRTIVLADKAYDADRIRELIQDQGAASLLATTSSPPTSSP